PFVVSLAAMLLCVALAACSSQADSAQKPDATPLDTDSAPEEETDTPQTSTEDPEDDSRQTPPGWPAHPQEPEAGDRETKDEQEDDETRHDAATGGEHGKPDT